MTTPRRRTNAAPLPPFKVPAKSKWTVVQWKATARAYACLQALQDAGFEGADLREMAVTWMAESGGKRLAENKNTNGTIDRGPAQINAPMPLPNGTDGRTVWHLAAIETRRQFLARGFLPWYAHGGTNWLAMVPYVDAACALMDGADRDRHGFR
jgi:hypothetical protein